MGGQRAAGKEKAAQANRGGSGEEIKDRLSQPHAGWKLRGRGDRRAARLVSEASLRVDLRRSDPRRRPLHRPARVLGRVMDLQPLQYAMGFWRWKRLIQRAWAMGGQIIHHHTDHVRTRIMDIDQVTHALGKIHRRASLRDLHGAPWPVGIQAPALRDTACHAEHQRAAVESQDQGRDC
jgi:hypothetical protein